VSRDGQKFLMIKNAPADNQPVASTRAPVGMTDILNWAEELKARLPAR